MNTTTSAPDFLHDGGETGAMLRERDWSQLPFGPPSEWPQSLRTITALMLNTKFPMFIAWGPELRFFYNDSYIEVLGEKHPTAMGGRFRDIWSELWQDVQVWVASTLAGESLYHQNLPLTMRRNGYDEKTWFTFSYSPVRDDDGVINGVFCTVMETTAQVLAEMARNQENQHMRRLFEQAPGIIAVLREPNHTFEIANKAYLQLVGHRDLIGQSVRDALPELEGQGFYELLDQVYTTGVPHIGNQTLVKLQRTPGGALEERFVNFIFQPTRNASDVITGIFIEGSDVTDAVKTNVALLKSEERLREALIAARMVVWEWNLATGEMKLSDNAAQVFGRSWHRIGSVWKITHPDDLPAFNELFERTIASHGQCETTVRMIRPDNGEIIWIEVTGLVSCDDSGKASFVNGIALDVTQRRRAEEELLLANRRKDEFLAMLAHELRNPLAPIMAAAQLLKLTTLDAPRTEQVSDIISRQAEHMTRLIDDLLDVSRVTRGLVVLDNEALQFDEVIVNAIEQVSPLITSKKHRLTVQKSEVPIVVRGDRTRLVQVLTNLINNAAKYTPEGGHIELRTRLQNDQVEFTVTDNGIGISADLLPYVFDLFSQAERSPDRSQGGLGLGLALVRSVTELHHGTVTAHSDGAGKGSEFMLTLPQLHDSKLASSSDKTSPSASENSTGLRILIVDDNKDAAQLTALLLEALGHVAAVEHTAEGALKRARQQVPDAMFIDIGLPDISGLELARRFRAQPETAHSTLIALTGYGGPQAHQQSTDAGFHHHLVKPASAAQIIALLAALKNTQRNPTAN